jgi:NSS family neurotransmitter:Na+ symporter
MKKERNTFTGKVGFVLAAAGASVGLGNIWRFPYLAAQYGGGIFLLIYIILAMTFGYTMIIAETAIGRMTKKSPVGAFKSFSDKKWIAAGGWINAIIPILIVPYYSVIGGWVIRYLAEYIIGDAHKLAQSDSFTNLIGSGLNSEIWFLVFTVCVLIIIFMGVRSGIERVSRVMMPILVILAIIVCIYSMTRPGAVEGIKYLLIPNLQNFSWMTVVAALGQLFYSLSIAMGILITYGSYMKKDVDIENATHQVEIFDSGVAILAGLMIIPAVFAFSGGDPEMLNKGPSLMFITMPKVFESMGMGGILGIVFFLLVLFAALTSAISLAETCVSTFQDELGLSRGKAAALVALITLALGSLSSLGYSSLSFVRLFGMEILDFFDFLTNSLMMPVAAFAICLFVVYSVGLDKVRGEICRSSKFHMEPVYRVTIRFIAPIFVVIILFSSIAQVFGWINM